MKLGYKTTETPVLDYCGTIIKSSPDSDRDADYKCYLAASLKRLDSLDTFFRLANQEFLPEKVGAGISGNGQFWKCKQ